jgi:uncharacterized cupredoxin-like copper-binding protein
MTMERTLGIMLLKATSTALIGFAFFHGAAHAHGTEGHGEHNVNGPYEVEQHPFGIAGHPKKLSRTVLVQLNDDKEFVPAAVRVKEGDTIRLVLQNRGQLKHEWVLGTDTDLRQQVQDRTRSGKALPDEVHRFQVDPGQTEEMVWTFNRPGQFKFTSLAPGRYQSGMVGVVTVEPTPAK